MTAVSAPTTRVASQLRNSRSRCGASLVSVVEAEHDETVTEGVEVGTRSD